MRVFVDDSFDPYKHLAIEHYFLYQDLNIEESPVLFIYRNLDSVVFGNFQNPWLEADINFCRENNIKLVRRFSGGGCVFHDLGNLNFCFIGPKNENSKSILSHLLINFLHKFHVAARLGEKSDILLDDQKISGSAFRETKNRTLHHCTLLFRADLDKLVRALSSPLKRTAVATHALASRPATVQNLSNFSWKDPLSLVQDFINDLKSHFILKNDELPKINFDTDMWQTREHLWEKTPRFSVVVGDSVLTIEKGCLTELSFQSKEKIIQQKELNIKLPCNKNEQALITFFNADSNLNQALLKWGLIF
jgi:lipoate-protein ligase A